MGFVVVDEPSCKDAAIQLGKQFSYVLNKRDYPSGCFTSSSSVYFNQKIDPSSTSPSPDSAGICRSGMVVNNHRV